MPKRNRESSTALSIYMPSSFPMPTSPQIFPEAVRAWAAAGTKSTRDTDLVRQNARNHLVATGWSSFKVKKANGYMELRYKSPAGKVFYSLRSACQSVDASQTPVGSQTTSIALVPKTTMTSLLPPLFRKKAFNSRNKRRKMRMRSMKDIMKDDRSVISGVVGILGRPSPVTGRGDLSWCLLKSELKDSKIHCQKLNQALEVMHECFEASIDPVTHTDVAEEIIFNEELDFYTVVLEMQDKVVTVANVRVHEGKVAEVSLAATAFDFRRQGMCKVLMNEIENWLRACGIERLVLPSTKHALKTWTSETMGFSTMGEDEKADLLIAYDCLDFQGTTMCQKQLLKKNKESDGNSSDGSTISHEEHAYTYVDSLWRVIDDRS